MSGFMLNRTRICRNACTAGIFMGTAAGALYSIVQRKWQDYRVRQIKTVHVMVVLTKNRKVTVFHV